MTSENRLLFDLGDILNIRIVCAKCHATFSAQPNKWERVPTSCQNCGEQWYFGNSMEDVAIDRFKKALETLKTAHKDRFTVQLEFAAHG